MENFDPNSEPSDMLLLIQGCKRHDRESQRLLYQHLYSYAMSICVRYCRTEEEAKEILNDGFLKMFQRIDQYKMTTSFRGWLRKIMINSCIDHYRKEVKYYSSGSIEKMELANDEISVLDEMAHDELMEMIQLLSPAYRTAFNLFVIDGYSHKEIGGMLKIAEGTSKSNLAKAREQLRKRIEIIPQTIYAKSV